MFRNACKNSRIKQELMMGISPHFHGVSECAISIKGVGLAARIQAPEFHIWKNIVASFLGSTDRALARGSPPRFMAGIDVELSNTSYVIIYGPHC